MLAYFIALMVCTEVCKPATLGDPVETVARRSSHVFVGTATNNDSLIRFKVSKWLQGRQSETIDIINPCSNCLPIEIGKQYLVYAYATPDGPMINPHTRTRLFSEVPALEMAKLEPDKDIRLNADEEAIIKTVLDAPGESVVVTGRTAPVWSMGKPEKLSATLYERLMLRSESERADLTPFDVPGAVRIESPSRIEDAFKEPDWDGYHKKFKASSIVSISLPIIDGDTALIYRSMTCGPLCGEGTVVKLVRQGKGWKIVERYPIWVS